MTSQNPKEEMLFAMIQMIEGASRVARLRGYSNESAIRAALHIALAHANFDLSTIDDVVNNIMDCAVRMTSDQSTATKN